MTVRIAWESTGKGEPVLLCQGLGYARWGWEPVTERLSRSFRVLAFDNRGIGESEVPPGPYTVAQLAADAVGVLDEAGVERAHVVGASLGGMVAQEVALAHPERVQKLVLVCTTPGGADSYPMPNGTASLLARASTMRPEVAMRAFVANALAEPGPLVDELTERRLAAPFDQGGWFAQAAAGATFNALDRVPSITAPTLVVTGDRDNVVDPRNAELLAERIPGGRLAVIEGTGHMLFWEQPDRFCGIVADFLR